MTRSIALGGLVVAALGSSARVLADFQVQSAIVSHVTEYNPGGATTTTVLNVSAPVASFNTVGADANGAIGTFSPTTITLRSQSQSGFDFSGLGPYALYNTDAINFASDTSFTLSGQLLQWHLIGSYEMRVKNLQADQSWIWRSTGTGIPVIQGDLASPAPAGNYQIVWSHSPVSQQSQFSRETFELTLTTIPEPLSITAIAAFIPAARRRR